MGLTDAFLGGVWLVHDGLAADRTQIDQFHVHDAEDPRRRAFFCLLPDGRPVLGATTYVTPSADLAAALQSMGVQEAILLDSGFSTSLVYGKKILVTGHTSPGIPSRPVPHALVLFGKPALHTPHSVLVASRQFSERGLPYSPCTCLTRSSNAVMSGSLASVGGGPSGSSISRSPNQTRSVPSTPYASASRS